MHTLAEISKDNKLLAVYLLHLVELMALEFLTEETTCTNEMPKETTCENICQKRPLLSGGTPWPGDTWHVPPGPVPAGACRRWHRRHVRLRSKPAAC
jgi:hypothetical protein